MTELDDDDGSRDDDAEAQRALSASIRDESRRLGLLASFGLVPFGLVLLVLLAIVGRLPGILVALLFFGYFAAMFLWLNYRRRTESDLPFVIHGHGAFTGERKRRLLAGGSLVVLALVLAVLAAEVSTPVLLERLRDWLVGWRI